MIIFLATLKAVLLFFGIGLIGFWIIAKKKVPTNILDVLSPLVIDIGLPCLVFYNIITKFDPSQMPNWWHLPLWWVGFTFFMFLLTWVTGIISKKDLRGEFKLSLLYPNSIFFSLAILPAIFGISSLMLVYLFLFTLLFPAFVFNTYMLFFKKTKDKEQPVDWLKLFNPVLIATLIAVALRLANLHAHIPDVIIDITKHLGAITLPLIMLLIGGVIFIDSEKKAKVQWGTLIKFVLVKNVVFPAATLLFLWLIQLPFPVALLIALISAAPPISASPVLVERAGGNTSLANQMLLGSFLFSILTVPITMMIFSRLYDLSSWIAY